MKEQLLGTTLPVLSISLEPGESVVAETGEFSWMTDSIQMSTGPRGGGRSAGAGAERGGGTNRAWGRGEQSGAGGQGLMGALKRAMGGSSLFLSTYTAKDAAGVIAFASKLPGSILGVGISPENEYLVHRHGFLAGTPGVQISTGFQQSFSAGIFAGEGFVLQRVGGQGRAWVELAGEVVTYDLAPGESLRVHPGHVGMFAASVSFQVMRVPGIANRYFGGDAHHFAVLSGPGPVWLQSMPMPVLAASLAPYLPQAQAHEQAHNMTESGVFGGIVGDLLH